MRASLCGVGVLLLLLLPACSSGGGDPRHGRVLAVGQDTAARTNTIQQNLAGFASASELERYRSIRSMLDLGRSADPYLIEALADADPRVRASARLAILFQHSDAMLQPLYGAFRQASIRGQIDTRKTALHGMLSFGKPAIPYFMRLLGESPEIRVQAVYALLEILELEPNADIPEPDAPNLVAYWQDWWSQNEATFVDPLDVMEPVALRSSEMALAIDAGDYFKAALAQQRWRILYYLRWKEAASAELLEPWRRMIGSLGVLRRNPALKPMDRDLLGVMISLCFEITGKGAEAQDVLAGIEPAEEHGGGIAILAHFQELTNFWTHRRLGEFPEAGLALERAEGLLESGMVPQSVGLRRLYRVHRTFFEEWSEVK